MLVFHSHVKFPKRKSFEIFSARVGEKKVEHNYHEHPWVYSIVVYEMGLKFRKFRIITVSG